jgi:hypothetical protein
MNKTSFDNNLSRSQDGLAKEEGAEDIGCAKPNRQFGQLFLQLRHLSTCCALYEK